MKILITGAAGFIGSHTVDKLLASGHSVTGIDNMSNGKFSNIEAALKNNRFSFIEGDVSHIFNDLDQFDLVVHLAALGSVPRSTEHPQATFEHNVVKFHQLLCALRSSHCNRLIYASSSSVLGGAFSPLPQSNYAVSKYVNELYAEQFSKFYKLQLIGLRFFNVYGPRQRSDSPYSAVIPKLLNDPKIYIHRPGTQSRDFTYVKDVTQAIDRLAYRGDLNSKVYDLGYGQARGLYELIDALRRLLPERVFQYTMLPPRPGDVLFSQAVNTPLKTDTGWTPEFDLEAGLSDMLFNEN